MIKEKTRNYNLCKTLTTMPVCNKKLAFLTETIRLVKPAIEDIKNGNYITLDEFGVWLDELYSQYE